MLILLRGSHFDLGNHSLLYRHHRCGHFHSKHPIHESIQNSEHAADYYRKCPPTRNRWGELISTRCSVKHETWVTSGIVNLVSDFSILILPFPIIWRLQMPWEKKFWIMVVFGLGFLACITSVLRLIYCIEIPRVGDSPAAYINIFRSALYRYTKAITESWGLRG